MGLDFATRCTQTFKRSWDIGRMEMTEPDLFRRHPEIQGPTYRLAPSEGVSFRDGEEILLRHSDEGLAAFRSRVRVGTIAKPTQALIEAVREGGGTLCARVQRVHPRSGAADVSIIA